MKLKVNKQLPTASKERRARTVRCAAGAILGVGVLISGFMIPSAAQPSGPGPKYTETLGKSLVKLEMVPIPGGTVKIGGKDVTVKPFYMAATETPWEAYDAFTASGPPSPSYGQEIPPDALALPSKSYILPDLGWGHDGYPVINVSFLSVSMFCRWMSETTGKKYRLPTEAEWEWACRTGVAGPWKTDKATADKIAWWAGNSEGMTHEVGKKQPNKWGLYDMFGNPGEWATDMEGKPVLCGGTHRDGLNGLIPNMRRRQTPAWQLTDPQFPKSKWWLADGNFVGFRVVREP